MPSRQPNRVIRRSYRGAASYNGPRKSKTFQASSVLSKELTFRDERSEATRLAHSIDERMGFPRYESGKKRKGWLCNMHSTTIEDEKVPGGRAAVDFYFLEDDSASGGDGTGTFKATLEYEPYFLIGVRRGRETEVEEWLRRKCEGLVKRIKRIEKEDLQMVSIEFRESNN